VIALDRGDRERRTHRCMVRILSELVTL